MGLGGVSYVCENGGSEEGLAYKIIMLCSARMIQKVT